MRKAKTKGGGTALFYTVENGVTGLEFVSHLTAYAYRHDDDLRNMTKSKAKEIIKKEIRQFGRTGEFREEDLGVDNYDQYNLMYSNARSWTIKNYPFLFEHETFNDEQA